MFTALAEEGAAVHHTPRGQVVRDRAMARQAVRDGIRSRHVLIRRRCSFYLGMSERTLDRWENLMRTSWIAAALAALAGSNGMAAVVRLDNVSYGSAPGYSVSVSGTDRFGTTGSASADELQAQVGGRLVGPNWPPFLTAGLQIYADTKTGGLLGTPYTVQGVRSGADLTFVWRLAGGYTGVSDQQAFRIDAAWGLYNGNQLFGGRFDGLSFVDTTPAAGDFAGKLEGTLFCQDNGSTFDDDCGSGWNGQGERFVSVRDNRSAGQLASNISIAGSGANTQAQYSIELVQVLIAAQDLLGSSASADRQLSRTAFGPSLAHDDAVHGDLTAPAGPGGAFIQFASGRTLAITTAGSPQAVPAPGSAGLAIMALLLAAAAGSSGGRKGAAGASLR